MKFHCDDTGTTATTTRGSRHRWMPALTASILVAGGAAPGEHAAAHALGDFGPCPSELRLPEPFTGRAQCATLTVPEQQAVPGARALALPVLRLKATAAVPGVPVFVLNGGPGAPNLSGVRPFVQVGQAHDVIYVGYRGAEGSTVLQCPEVQARLGVPEILSRTNLDALTAAGSACAERLARSGIDPAHYTILDVIDDLEAARSALGYERVDLLSMSYGTRVAQYYARRHPQRIHRSVMLGANPPGHFVFSARINDEVLGRLSRLCAADAYCSSRTEDLRETVLKALHRAGVPGATGVDDGRTRLGLFAAMYRRDAFVAFVDAVIAAESGHGSQLEEAVRRSGGAYESMIWGDLMSKGVLDSYRYPALEPTCATTAVSMGSPFDLLYQAVGRQWPKPRLDEQYRRAVPDPTPTLVINGDLDVATPLPFVESELMPYLSHGKLLVLRNYGHGDVGRQGAAIDQIIARYLATGELDAAALREDPYVFRP